MPAVADAFGPTILVTTQGCDGHHLDPLSNLDLSTAALHRAARLLDERRPPPHGGPLARHRRRRLRPVPRRAPVLGADLAGDGPSRGPTCDARGLARPLGLRGPAARPGTAPDPAPRPSVARAACVRPRDRGQPRHHGPGARSHPRDPGRASSAPVTPADACRGVGPVAGPRADAGGMPWHRPVGRRPNSCAGSGLSGSPRALRAHVVG